MTKIRLASDIHLDFDIDKFNKLKRKHTPEVLSAGEMNFLWRPQALPDDKDTIMVIAGDLWTSGKYITRKYPDNDSWMDKISKQFKYVVFVLGNHDYWGGNISDEAVKVKKSIGHLDNVFLLEKDTVVLDNIKFVGATLWTDYNNHDQEIMYNAPNKMNDYKKIRYGAKYGRLSAAQVYKIHMESRLYIFENAVKDSSEQKLMVITHMPPSEKSIPQEYRDNPTPNNHYYYTDLESRIVESEIDYWFHGHTHNKSSYKIGNTQVEANPRGYVGEKNIEFNDEFLLDLDNLEKKQRPKT